MEELNLSEIPEEIKGNVQSFFLDILSQNKEDIITLYLTGSVVTKDFNPKISDINSTIVVKEMKIPFFDYIATLGKRYGKKKIHAPLVMTPYYIERSLEVFPIEFLEMKLIHSLVYGNDVFKDIQIEKADIRLQCERELKGKIQQLSQGYIRAMGNRTILNELFLGALSSYFPIFRGILFLFDQKIPVEKNKVISTLKECCKVNIDMFTNLLEIRAKNIKPSGEEFKEIFKELYNEIDTLAKKIDEFELKA